MSRVIIAMVGARRHYAVPRVVYQMGILERFYTDAYIGNKLWLEKILTAIPRILQRNLIKRWLGRKDMVVPGDKVRSFDWLGILYTVARSRARSAAQVDRVDILMAKAFSRRILSNGIGNVNIVYGFNGAAVELFEAAKRQGVHCVLDQTILCKRQETELLREERQRWDGWQPGLNVNDSKLAEREKREWALADHIVAGSDFVRKGLIEEGVPAIKIHVLPYGADAQRFANNSASVSSQATHGGLRILFAGAVGIRKGAPDLLEALQQLSNKKVEAKFAGRIDLESSKLNSIAGNIQFLGQIPRSEMIKLYRWADVFVLPSIVEGSAMATYEALMMGLPVITTPNSGSLVTDGINGFIVPIRNPKMLAWSISKYCDDSRLLDRHKKAALASHEQVSLDRYDRDLRSFFHKISSAL